MASPDGLPVNPWAGEVSLVVDGQARCLKLTLGALAELEHALGEDSLTDLIARFDSGACSANDILCLLVAGLRGGGWSGTKADLIAAEIEGGLINAARVAARLLVAAFAPEQTAP